MTDKDRIDRMIRDNELDKKFVTLAEMLTFIENQRKDLFSRISENPYCYIVDSAFVMLEQELRDEASKPPFKYPPYKDVTYTLNDVLKIISENRETILDDICAYYAKDSARSKNRAIDIVNATLRKVECYLNMDYNERVMDIAQTCKVVTLASKESYYDPDSLYPTDTGNCTVKATSKDTTIDTPTVTITITQKETNK